MGSDLKTKGYEGEWIEGMKTNDFFRVSWIVGAGALGKLFAGALDAKVPPEVSILLGASASGAVRRESEAPQVTDIMVILTGKYTSEWLNQGSDGDVALVRKMIKAVKSEFTDEDEKRLPAKWLTSDYFGDKIQVLYGLRLQLLAFLRKCVKAGGISHD